MFLCKVEVIQCCIKWNRRYTSQEYFDFIEKALKMVPKLCVGTDVIVGYPGESDALFDETYGFLEKD